MYKVDVVGVVVRKDDKAKLFLYSGGFPCLLVCLSLTHARTYTHTFMYMRVRAHTCTHACVCARTHAHICVRQ